MNQTQWIKLHRSSLPVLVGVILSTQIHYLAVPSALAIPDAPLPQAQNCNAQIEGQWTWVDNSGQNKTGEELHDILNQHETWLKTAKREGRQADLSGAKLKGADLRSVSLSEANLTNSDLSYADLTRATLNGTVLRGTNWQCTRLDETYFQRADLENVDFSRAIISSKTIFDAAKLAGASLKGHDLHDIHFNGASLRGADLTGSDLTNAQLNGADLSNAKLKNSLLINAHLNAANLEGADLSGAAYEVSAHPVPKAIAFAKYIEQMTHTGDSASLAQLRALFKENGFRDQERKITYALKSSQGEFLWKACERNGGICFEYWVNRILFDLTSQYGMNPGRVLIIVLIIFSGSTVLYWGLIHRSSESGLSIIVSGDLDLKNQPRWLRENLSLTGRLSHEMRGASTVMEYSVRPKDIQHTRKLDYWKDLARREWVLFRVSFLFSLMSTFNLKFRDVDFGRWLRQLMTKEYDIKAKGWVRTVSGTQALLSLYFIALLLITYFGRPFE